MPPKFVPHVLTDGTEQIVNNMEYLAWKRSDRLFKAWITNSVSEELLPYTIGQKTSSDVWNTLKSSIAKSSIDTEFALHEQI